MVPFLGPVIFRLAKRNWRPIRRGEEAVHHLLIKGAQPRHVAIYDVGQSQTYGLNIRVTSRNRICLVRWFVVRLGADWIPEEVRAKPFLP